METALAIEDAEGATTRSLRAYQHALHADPHSAAAATNLGLVAKALGLLSGCMAAHMHAQAVEPSLRLTQAARLLPANTPLFSAVADPSEIAICMRSTLLACGFGAATAQILVGEGAAGGPATATECFRARGRVSSRLERVRPSPAEVAAALWLCGLSRAETEVIAAFGGRAEVNKLLMHGLLIHCPGDDELLCSPFQVYPLSLGNTEVWVAGDWDLESMHPSKLSVMPIGVDSLELAFAAPRNRIDAQVLDLCCGGGIQTLVAAATYAAHVVAVDINPRAVRFCSFRYS